MLRINRTSITKCTITADNTRIAKIRRALVLYCRDIGLPASVSKNVVTKMLSTVDTGIRLYRLTASVYVYVNYTEGQIVLGTDADIIAQVQEYSFAQICLWLAMADYAAQGKTMYWRDIRRFEIENDIAETLLKVNVAPLDKIAPKRPHRAKRTYAELEIGA